MLSARIRDDDSFCYGWALRGWAPEDVEAANKNDQFRCPGCQAGVTALSYKPHNQVSPHFRFAHGGGHDPTCQCSPKAVAANKALIDRDASIPTIVPYPIYLIDPPTERLVRSDDPDLASAEDQRPSSIPPRLNMDGEAARAAASRPTLIGAFAAAHMEMNHAQRIIARIELPGVTDAHRYQYAFKELPQWNITKLTSPRIFYGQLRYTAPIEDTGTTYRIQCHAGEWDNDTRSFTRPWTLVAHYENWTKTGHTLFLDEFHTVTSQAKRHQNEAWTYLLATQDPINLNELHVEIRQRIAFTERKPAQKKRSRT
ncbi:hypothetical protein [Rhodococcus sp. BH5]|uniref:hypothetical protein n=1 Tax=Rhodococcus sp. BH5 TaxID=2871702 RepID=UPI0022CD7203|nr:hypothetical protein [Rhodococcus sp. BH5]MCZ9634959.1 hypothetical protein [Rhodococcus sp. BH5]